MIEQDKPISRESLLKVHRWLNVQPLHRLGAMYAHTTEPILKQHILEALRPCYDKDRLEKSTPFNPEEEL